MWAPWNRSLARITYRAQTLLHKGLAPRALEDDPTGRTRSAPLSKNPLARTVLALSQQGRSIDEIVDVVYTLALDAGGGLVHLGIWKRCLDSEVRGTHSDLIEAGFLGEIIKLK